MIDKVKTLIKHKTFENIIYLTGASVFAQLISLVGAFYIPRLLGPEKYGVFQIVGAYVGIFTFLTFDGINKIILRECSRNLDKAKEIIESLIGFKNLCAIFSIIISIIALIFIDYNKITQLYIIIFSITLLLNGLNSTINIVYQAYEQMKPIAIFSILRSIIYVSIAILLLKTGYGVLSLIILQISVSVLILIANYIYSRRFVKLKILSNVKIVKSYIKQGFTFSLLGLLTTLSGKVDIFMLSILTTPQNVGIYALAYNIVQKGLIIRGPISVSLFPYYTKKYTRQNVEIKELIKHTLIIIIPSIVIIIGVLFSSKFIITTIVGDAFVESAKILNVLIFYLILNYFVIPWGLALQTTYNEKYEIHVGLLGAILNVGLNILMYYKWGIIGIAYSTLITIIMSNFYLVYLVSKKTIKK